MGETPFTGSNRPVRYIDKTVSTISPIFPVLLLFELLLT